MTHVTYLIPENKRQAFDQRWEELLPDKFKDGQNYTATRYSESPFPYFDREFLQTLPSEYRRGLKDLYKKVVLD